MSSGVALSSSQKQKSGSMKAGSRISNYLHKFGLESLMLCYALVVARF